MERVRFIALPGFHGDDSLFSSLGEARPAWAELIPVSLPDAVLDYEALADDIAAKVQRNGGHLVLLAESFSGPLAVLLATRLEVRALVLVATFVSSPIPRLLSWLPWPLVAWIKPPLWLIQFLLTGGDRQLAIQVRTSMLGLKPRVLAARFRALSNVDVQSQLRQVACRLLYIQATEDRVVSPKHYREIAAARHDVEYKPVNAPHLVLQSAPDEVWNLLAEFEVTQEP